MKKFNDLVLAYLADGESYSLSDIADELPLEKYVGRKKYAGYVLANMVKDGLLIRPQAGYYQLRKDIDPAYFDTYSHGYRKRCANLLRRTQAYRKVHPVTYKGLAKACGANDVKASAFYCMGTQTMPLEDVEKIERFLTERGF